MGRRLRWPLDTRATLGGLASWSLLSNVRWSAVLSDLPDLARFQAVPLLDDIVAAVGSIATNTLLSPVAGVGMTFLLVLLIMYQAVGRLKIRETADFYETDRFRVAMVVIAGGFGIGLIVYLGEIDAAAIPWVESLVVPLSVWYVLSWLSTSAALVLWTRPADRDNPVVALLARVTGEEPTEYRRQQITETWAPTWLAAGVATLAVGIILTLLGALLGGVVAIATLLYPLPELSVLLWVGAQLAGIHRLPYLGWVESVETEDKLYDRLGSGTVTIYGVFVALAYLVALVISTLLFASVGVPVFLSGADSLGQLLSSAKPRLLFTSFEVAISVLVLVALTIGPILAALYYVAYWVLAILRLPAVASSVLQGYDADIAPSYPRLEGRTLPAGVLVIWTATLVRVEPFGQPLVQALFVLVFLVGAVPTAWTLYRATVGPLAPQSVGNEERTLVSAAALQGGTNSVAFLLAGETSVRAALVLTVLFVGTVAGAQYFGRKAHEESVDETDSAYSSGLLVAACLVLGALIHWQFPEFSPVLPAVLLVGAVAMTITHLMDRRHR